jgi:hypothetical protein
VTIDEFKALKVGDVVRNPMTHAHGAVERVDVRRGARFVDIRWHQALLTTTFAEHSTAWMHWTGESEGDQ